MLRIISSFFLWPYACAKCRPTHGTGSTRPTVDSLITYHWRRDRNWTDDVASKHAVHCHWSAVPQLPSSLHQPLTLMPTFTILTTGLSQWKLLTLIAVQAARWFPVVVQPHRADDVDACGNEHKRRRIGSLNVFILSLFFVSGPCARLSSPSRQLLSARKSTVSYRIVSYDNWTCTLVLPDDHSFLLSFIS